MVQRDQRATKSELRIPLDQVLHILNGAGRRCPTTEASSSVRSRLALESRRPGARRAPAPGAAGSIAAACRRRASPSPSATESAIHRSSPLRGIHALVKERRDRRCPAVAGVAPREAAAIAAYICCAQISYMAASMCSPTPLRSALCRALPRRGGHDVGNDHVAIRHGARNDRAAIGPAGEIGAAGQSRAGAIHTPFLRERPRLTEHAAGDHDHRRVARGQLRDSRGRASPSCRARSSRPPHRPTR